MSAGECIRYEDCTQSGCDICNFNPGLSNQFVPIFEEPCKVNGNPRIGLCTRKSHYEKCSAQSNWICWRDRILVVEKYKVTW